MEIPVQDNTIRGIVKRVLPRVIKRTGYPKMQTRVVEDKVEGVDIKLLYRGSFTVCLIQAKWSDHKDGEGDVVACGVAKRSAKDKTDTSIGDTIAITRALEDYLR